MKNNAFMFFTIIYYIKGYIKSYIPFLKNKRDIKTKIIFPILPKFSNDGNIFWFTKCVRQESYAAELGYRIYRYDSMENYNKKKFI